MQPWRKINKIIVFGVLSLAPCYSEKYERRYVGMISPDITISNHRLRWAVDGMRFTAPLLKSKKPCRSFTSLQMRHTHPAVAGFHFWKKMAFGRVGARMGVNRQKSWNTYRRSLHSEGKFEACWRIWIASWSSCVTPSSMYHWVPQMPSQPSGYLIIVWLDPESWWGDQFHLEKRSSQSGHCEKDCSHVVEESQNDGANNRQFARTIPNCQIGRRNSVQDHDIWKFLRSISLQRIAPWCCWSE